MSVKIRPVGIATDLGKYNDYIVDNLQNLDALLLEANHDIRMLQGGKLSLLSETAYLRATGDIFPMRMQAGFYAGCCMTI